MCTNNCDGDCKTPCKQCTCETGEGMSYALYERSYHNTEILRGITKDEAFASAWVDAERSRMPSGEYLYERFYAQMPKECL